MLARESDRRTVGLEAITWAGGLPERPASGASKPPSAAIEDEDVGRERIVLRETGRVAVVADAVIALARQTRPRFQDVHLKVSFVADERDIGRKIEVGYEGFHLKAFRHDDVF